MEITLYKSKNFDYIRISDIPDESLRREFEEWMFGQTQPLIQGEGEGVPAILDAVFVWDYNRFLDHKAGKEVILD